MTERLNYQRFAWVQGRLKICNVWQSPLMTAPAFYYREVTALEFIGYAIANHGDTVHTASAKWYRRAQEGYTA